ncbi:beta-alanine-activating enzyme-like [Nilaparvata lugens]|uniref:beta-alanine-activating enzyme-like n=1 Tax=Nilaparvata lugens TaxID=108931 RepID=UPI00193D90A4|nr:beta-alanine-activating enzyme-like [Nilaparvata lugens]
MLETSVGGLITIMLGGGLVEKDLLKMWGKSLKFVGRRDRVMKRWGQKVNLGLIEEAAMKSDYVSNCCCINDVTRGLVLFYQADNFQIDHNSQLKFWLKREGLLPNNASVPDTLIQLHELPLNCNGKIDRSQLEKILRELTHLKQIQL